MFRRYVAVCRQLAGYSAINNDSGINIKWVNGGKPEIELEFPAPEAFGGTALAFRQLHSQAEAASFDRSKGRLMKAIKLLPDPSRTPKSVVVQWAKARGKLMNRLLQNIVSTRWLRPPAPDNFPFSYGNVNPQKLILTFNYGGTIHFSREKEKLSSCWRPKRMRPTTSTPSCSPSPTSATCTSASRCWRRRRWVRPQMFDAKVLKVLIATPGDTAEKLSDHEEPPQLEQPTRRDRRRHGPSPPLEIGHRPIAQS